MLEFWQTNTPIGFGGAVGTPVTLQLANGNIMVLWSGNGVNGLNYAIYDPLAVQQSSGNLSPAATVPLYVYDLIPTADGGFDILYRQDGNLVSNLYLQHFSSALVGGTPLFVAGDFATSTNLPAGAVALAGGGYAVAYTSKTGYPSFDYGNISLRLIDSNGNVGSDITVNTTTAGRQLDARVATNGQNLFVTWWDEATQDVRGQMLTLGGAKIGNEFLVPSTTVGDAGRPQIEAFANGNYIVVWEAVNADGADTSSGSARARLFDPSGTPLGSEFVLNSQTSGFQGGPDVTIMPDGSFFASWFQDSSGFFRWFNGDGTPKPDSEISTTFPGFQTSLVTIDDGRIAAFGIDSNLQWVIIDTRNGNYNGNELDNQLVARRTGPTTIYGYGGNDTFYGNDDNDTMYGGTGNDVFRSKLGQDLLTGGPGDDTYYLTAFSHTAQHLTTIVEAPNEGIDTIWTWGNYTIPANVEVVVLYEDAGSGSLTGNSTDNTLIGNSAGNALSGLAGNDTLQGLAGTDTLTGGAGRDTFRGSIAEMNGDRILDFSVLDTIQVSNASAATFSFTRSGSSLSFGGVSMTVDGLEALNLSFRTAASGGVELYSTGARTLFDNSGDARADLLWTNNAGLIGEWDSLGSSFVIGPGGAAGSGWSVVGRADFNGDGRSDVLWRNTAGTVATWYSTGSGFAAGMGSAAPTDWSIVGTGDFNGDGLGDLLWRNTTGTVATWYSNGSAFGAGPGSGASTEWSIAGTGDFNGDGKTDIMWRHSSGGFAEWLSSGSGFLPGPGGFNSSDWAISGIGDFDGDGKADIIWRNSNGSYAEWYSRGDGFAVGLTGSVASSWQIQDVADYNGDGRADLGWRDSLGNVSAWFTSDAGFVQGFNGFAPIQWQIV